MLNLDKLMNQYYETRDEDIIYSFCPYRVCPLGAHIDHQKGNVTGFAIDKGITIAYIPSNDHFFEAISTNFTGRKGDSILDLPDKKGDWADYIRGTVAILRKHYGIDRGIKCVIDGSLPIGGISSSAAVINAFMNALCNVNEIELSDYAYR